MTNEVSLREYVEKIIDERSARHSEQVVAQERSVALAARALEIRLEQMNEFRLQLERERALYVRTDHLKPYLERIEMLERWRSNVSGRQVVFGFAVVILSGIIPAVLRLVGH